MNDASTAVLLPPVEELLAVDRAFRASASRVPFLHLSSSGRRYSALYSQSALARRMNRENDWVIVDLEVPGPNPRWTVVTERRGILKGRRVVRGREVECYAWYRPPHGGRHAAA